MPEAGFFSFNAKDINTRQRLDQVIASRLPGCSRSYASLLIQNKKILVKGKVKKPGYRVKPGDEISGIIPEPETIKAEPEPLHLQILYEDKHLIVIDKKAGVVVHPAPGHPSGTIVNGILYHCPDIAAIGGKLRPGIVHRLDKDTSGTMVIAKNSESHNNLVEQFKSRNIKKEYLALVYGSMDSDSGFIKLPIGRHPVDRKKMSTFSKRGRYAETCWSTKEDFKGASFLKVKIKTGRTHQIRVHLSAINHPLVGDSVYCSGKKFKKASGPAAEVLKNVKRQMLHSHRLVFIHPATGNEMAFVSKLPDDMAKTIDQLRNAEFLKGML